MGWNKIKRLTLIQQMAGLKKDFGDGKISFNRNKLTWEGMLKSSPLGDEYKIKLVYENGQSPKVFVLEPQPLKLAEGKTRLPHVYDHQKQRLCLYYPDGREWNSSKPIAQTIMIWTMEWLYFYELWLITGKWLGGGTNHGISKTETKNAK